MIYDKDDSTRIKYTSVKHDRAIRPFSRDGRVVMRRHGHGRVALTGSSELEPFDFAFCARHPKLSRTKKDGAGIPSQSRKMNVRRLFHKSIPEVQSINHMKIVNRAITPHSKHCCIASACPIIPRACHTKAHNRCPQQPTQHVPPWPNEFRVTDVPERMDCDVSICDFLKWLKSAYEHGTVCAQCR